VFPHDQNTSGFFITIIKKTKDFDAAEEDHPTEKKQPEESKQSSG